MAGGRRRRSRGRAAALLPEALDFNQMSNDPSDATEVCIEDVEHRHLSDAGAPREVFCAEYDGCDEMHCCYPGEELCRYGNETTRRLPPKLPDDMIWDGTEWHRIDPRP